MNLRPPILVTGCQRSGLSMVAGALYQCGAFIGGTRTDPFRDAYENKQLYEELVAPYLQMAGVPRDGSLPTSSGLLVPFWAERVESILIEQGLRPDSPWVVKGPHVALCWKQWATAYPAARWVIVRRDPGDLARSCHLTGYMDSRTSEEGWRAWVDEWGRLLGDLELGVGYCRHVVEPYRFLGGDRAQLRGLVEASGLTWDEEKMNAFLPKNDKGNQP